MQERLAIIVWIAWALFIATLVLLPGFPSTDLISEDDVRGLVLGFVVVSLTILAYMWLTALVKYLRVSIVVASEMPVTQPPSDLPAAAVSVLRRGEATPQTLLTIIVEICQKRSLRVTGIREASDSNEGSERKDKYTYRLTPSGGFLSEWERTLRAAIPYGNVTVSELSARLDAQSTDISDYLGEFLHNRGLFDGNPTSTPKLFWTGVLKWLGIVLLGIVLGLGLVGTLTSGAWWERALFLLLFILGFGLLHGGYWHFSVSAHENMKQLSKVPPNHAGVEEIGRWMRLEGYLRFIDKASRTDQLLPYAVALDAAYRWLDDVPPWFEVAGAESPKGLGSNRLEAYRGFMRTEAWNLSGRSIGASGWVWGGGDDGGVDGSGVDIGGGGDGGFSLDL